MTMENNNNQVVKKEFSIINNVEMNQIQNTMNKINQFQKIVKDTLNQNHDFGVIPGTGSKPTLLKPGAEKLLMLMGLRSEFDIADSTRDWEKGFFQYQVKCRLIKGDLVVTEGMGSCNSKERKYIKQDPYSIDNTILKMAKKRSLVDAALLVGSLSDIFTQDLEDIDIQGYKTSSNVTTHDDTSTISKGQAKRIYAISGGNADICTKVLKKHGYNKSDEVKKVDYSKICDEVELEAKKDKEDLEGTPFEEV